MCVCVCAAAVPAHAAARTSNGALANDRDRPLHPHTSHHTHHTHTRPPRSASCVRTVREAVLHVSFGSRVLLVATMTACGRCNEGQGTSARSQSMASRAIFRMTTRAHVTAP